MALSGSWPKCPPESASCCLRAAVDRRSRQPEGSRRRSRAGILAMSPRPPCDYSIISKKYKFPLRADYDSTDFHNARPRAVIMTIMPALGR